MYDVGDPSRLHFKDVAKRITRDKTIAVAPQSLVVDPAGHGDRCDCVYVLLDD